MKQKLKIEFFFVKSIMQSLLPSSSSYYYSIYIMIFTLLFLSICEDSNMCGGIKRNISIIVAAFGINSKILVTTEQNNLKWKHTSVDTPFCKPGNSSSHCFDSSESATRVSTMAAANWKTPLVICSPGANGKKQEKKKKPAELQTKKTAALRWIARDRFTPTALQISGGVRAKMPGRFYAVHTEWVLKSYIKSKTSGGSKFNR